MTQNLREIILHIGNTKTGTTSLQFAFFKLKDELQANGICYPNLVGTGFGWTVDRGMSTGNADTNARFDWEMYEQEDRLLWLIEKSLATCNPEDTIILSSEHLSRLTVPESFWKNISEISRKHSCRIKVIFYIRDPFSMLLACYQQFVKENGFAGDLGSFLDPFWDGQHPISFFSQRNLRNTIKFAKDYSCELELFRYEETNSNIEKHFFSKVLDLDIEKFNFESKKINTSLSPIEVDFHRGINANSPRMGELLGFERNDILLSRNIKHFFFEQDKYLLSNENQVKIVQLFKEYRDSLVGLVDFAERIDIDLNHKKIANSIDPVFDTYREQVFELGKFVAAAYETGYVQWNWQNENNR
jgi:hypothetical protein